MPPFLTDATYFPLLFLILLIPGALYLYDMGKSGGGYGWRWSPPSQLNFAETGVTVVLAFLLLTGQFYMFRASRMSDTQFVGGYITSKGGPFTHDCNCRCDDWNTDDEGNHTSCRHETCDTCYRWEVYTSLQFNGHGTFVTSDSTAPGPDGEWQSYTPGQPCVFQDGYENILSASGNSLLGHPKSPLTEKLQQAGYIPPRFESRMLSRTTAATAVFVGKTLPAGIGATTPIADNVQQLNDWVPLTMSAAPLIGMGVKDAVAALGEARPAGDSLGLASSLFNGTPLPEVGKQGTIEYILTDYPDAEYATAVMDAWKGGAKNSIVAFLGVDAKGVIKWASMKFGIPGTNLTEAERTGDNNRLAVEFQAAMLDKVKLLNPRSVVYSTTTLALQWFNRVPNKQFEQIKDTVKLDDGQIWFVYIFTLLVTVIVTGAFRIYDPFELDGR